MSGRPDDDTRDAAIAPAAPAPASALIQGVHHVGVRAVDLVASERFWCGTLGLVRHPEKANWLGLPGSSHRFIHLMPARDGERPSASAEVDAHDLAQHVALEVTNLQAIVRCLLRDGWRPFQADLKANRRDITSADDTLDFGIGTVFVVDPAGNVVEFVQRDRGIFAAIQG